jgi:outer membrane protein assembly factor BamB
MYRFTCLALFVVCLSLPTASAEELNWPQFRGPHGDGKTSNTGLPLTWSETENVRWKTPIHGKGHSSPVIWDNQIWMTTATEDGKERWAVCCDLATGKIVHDIKLLDDPKPQFSHEMNSHATGTPVVEAGRVYLHFGSTGTWCVDTASGQVLWKRLDLHCDHHRGAASSPIVFENLLILPFDGFDVQYVVALNKATGDTVWKRDRGIAYKNDNGDIKKAYGTGHVIDVDGKPQLVIPSAEATIAYEPLTGEEIWRVRHGGMNASARPLFDRGRLIINTGAGGHRLFSVKANGRGDVTDTHIEWKYGKTVPTRSSQILVGDLLFMVADSGIGACINALTAEPVWTERFGGDFSASPLFAEGRIYFFSESGRTPVVAAGPEYKLLADNQLGDGFMASPAVSGKALILRSRTHLYRIETP